jgi:valyl-tRNA synthetase
MWQAMLISAGLPPSKQIFIHGFVTNDGQKMSKSLGNGIDPMDVIESHGTDALRLFLTSNSAPGQDLRYSTEKMDSTWNFINKVWNVSRFVLMNTDNVDNTSNLDVNTMDSADHYLINRLNETITSVSTFMDKYEFSIASTELYNFIWEDFANWYVEVSKSYLLGDNIDKKVNRQVVLKTVLEDIIKMLHPFTPFVTDEIYTQFSNVDSVMLTTWPEVLVNVVNQDEVMKFEKIKEIIVGLRNMRAENDIKPSLPLDVVIETELILNDDDINILKTMAKINEITFILDPSVEVITFVTSVSVVNVINDGIIDNDAKVAGLNEQLTKLENEISRSVNMLSNANFVSRAPADKINSEVEKGLGYIKQYQDVCEVLSKLGVNGLNEQLIDDAKKILEEV